MTHGVYKCHFRKSMPWVKMADPLKYISLETSERPPWLIVTNLLPKIAFPLYCNGKEMENNMHTLFAKQTAINHEATPLNTMINQKIMDSCIY